MYEHFFREEEEREKEAHTEAMVDEEKRREKGEKREKWGETKRIAYPSSCYLSSSSSSSVVHSLSLSLTHTPAQHTSSEEWRYKARKEGMKGFLLFYFCRYACR